jgi:hypothetical protein
MATSRPSLYLAVVLLASTALFQTVVSVLVPDAKTAGSNRLGAIICLIACVHYIGLLLAPASSVMAIRYSDWLLTLPLLLWEIFRILEIDIYGRYWVRFLGAIALLLGMLAAGWKGVETASTHPRQATLWLVVGCVCLIALDVFVCVTVDPLDNDGLKLVTLIIFLGWALYGLVAAYPLTATSTQLAYDVLDIGTKAGFGVVVGTYALTRLADTSTAVEDEPRGPAGQGVLQHGSGTSPTN